MRRSRHSVYRKENKPEVTGRLFFALWPPGSAAQALHGWASAAHAQTGGRITREPTIHLTLAFLGDLPLEQVSTLKACAKRVQGRAFEMRLDEGRPFGGALFGRFDAAFPFHDGPAIIAILGQFGKDRAKIDLPVAQ